MATSHTVTSEAPITPGRPVNAASHVDSGSVSAVNSGTLHHVEADSGVGPKFCAEVCSICINPLLNVVRKQGQWWQVLLKLRTQILSNYALLAYAYFLILGNKFFKMDNLKFGWIESPLSQSIWWYLQGDNIFQVREAEEAQGNRGRGMWAVSTPSPGSVWTVLAGFGGRSIEQLV